MPIVAMVSSSNVNDAKFRFVCDVTVAGSVVARLKVLPNSNNVGVFRLDRVINQYLELSLHRQDDASKPLWELGKTAGKLFSNNSGGPYRTVTYKFGEEKATSSATDPTVTMDAATHTVRVIAATLGYLGGRVALPTYQYGGSYGSQALDTEYLDTLVGLTTASSTMMSTRPDSGSAFGTGMSGVAAIQEDVDYGDSRVYSFIADSNIVGTGDKYVVIDVEQTNGVVERYSVQLGSLGSTAPISVSNDLGRLQYVGVGPANLAKINNEVNEHFVTETVKRYSVTFATSSNPSNGSQIKSRSHIFNIVDADCKYKQNVISTGLMVNQRTDITLCWQNAVGGYDYQKFTKRSDRTLKNIKRKTYETLGGNYDSASATVDFRIRPWEGGTRVTKISARTEMRVNTDIFDPAYVEYLEGLLTSPRVYLLTNDSVVGVIPVTITDSSFLHKTRVNERSGFTFSVTFEFARPNVTTT